MNFQFNPAQLSRPQRNNLIEVLGVIESENDQEIEVTVVEFPEKLMVKLDDDTEMILVWDFDKQSYSGLTKPEPEPESDELGIGAKIEIPKYTPDLDPKVKELAERTFALMEIHLTFSPEQQLAFNKEYAKLWKERSE